MSAATGVLKKRMQRLLDERETVTNLHEDLLSHVEAREGDQEFTEVEQKQADGYRARAGELDAEIEALAEDLKREEASAEAAKDIRTQLAGRMEGVTRKGDDIVYEQFSAYARDFIL